MTTIYYAHPMSWYDTPEEKLDLERLALNGDVTNPNSDYFHTRVKQAKKHGFNVMNIFAEEIQNSCDVVAFRRFKDGKIGAGVAREIFEAWIWNKPVWEVVTTMSGVRVWTDRMCEYDAFLHDVCTVEETKRRIQAGEL